MQIPEVELEITLRMVMGVEMEVESTMELETEAVPVEVEVGVEMEITVEMEILAVTEMGTKIETVILMTVIHYVRALTAHPHLQTLQQVLPKNNLEIFQILQLGITIQIENCTYFLLIQF